MTETTETDNPDSALLPWDPYRSLRRVDEAIARFSRGFLRCRPEKWFPGFAAHWLPLAHSLGLEMKIVEAKPMLTPPHGIESMFVGTVDGEPLLLMIDGESRRHLLDAATPGTLPGAGEVIVEYFARRLLTSLSLCWSGPESSVIRFEVEMDPAAISVAGAVKLSATFNNNPVTVWIGLGQGMIDRLDGLWRRQLHSGVRKSDEETVVRLCIAQLAVPPAMLSEYLRSGTVIDLEVPVSENITLYSGSKAWLPARLCSIDQTLGVEVVPGQITPSLLPDGTTRLSIEFGSLQLQAGAAAELAQAGALWHTEIPVTNIVEMVINNETVGRGTLCTYEGRFAISVN